MNAGRRLTIIHYCRLIAMVAVVMVGCAGPVDDDDIVTSELESVWQYLRVYSIYQWDDSTRIPDNPFAFSSPYKLMAAIHDTLGGSNYTAYNIIPHSYGASAHTAAPSYKNTTVFLDTLTDSTARIRITSFDPGTTFYEFNLLLPGVATFPFIVVDLHGNGGGDIDEARDIVESFLPAGIKYLKVHEREYDRETKTAQTSNHYWETEEPARSELAGKKVIVVMDKSSASSSEILIAGLKEGINATLVGDTSYGKAIGQIEIVRIGRPAIKITYLQMSGVKKIGDYHRKGIPPDIAANDSDDILLTAVKVHEPLVTSLKKSSTTPPPAKMAVSGYRLLYE